MKKVTKLFTAPAAVVILILLVVQPAFAQQPNDEIKALRKEIETLKEGQAAMQKEMAEIKSLLQALLAREGGAPREIVFDVAGLPMKGDQGAKLTIIEFSDYQCPFCSRYVRETLPEIERDYIKSGKLRYVFHNLPLESLHEQAFKAAEAASCAAEQGKFWEMHDQMFSNQHALGLKELSLHAQALKLDLPAFQACLFGGKYEAKIRQEIANAGRVGADSTPLFFLGMNAPNDSKVKVLKVIAGAKPFAAFKQTIDGLLADLQQPRP